MNQQFRQEICGQNFDHLQFGFQLQASDEHGPENAFKGRRCLRHFGTSCEGVIAVNLPILGACNASSKYPKGSNECKTEQSARCGKTQHSTGMFQLSIENTSSQRPFVISISMLVYWSLQKCIV